MDTLETKRCILRPATIDDADDLFDCYKEDVVVKYLPFKKHKTINDTHKFIKNFFLENYKKGRIGHFVVVFKKTNKVIGNIGFNNISTHSREGEIGICINPKYWGHDLSTELALEIVRYGFETLDLESIIAITFEENKYSQKPLSKLDFTYVKSFKKKFINSTTNSVTCNKYQMTKEYYYNNI